MYRSLNVETLGVTGRQSELIELVLSYRFKGLDIDIEAFARQLNEKDEILQSTKSNYDFAKSEHDSLPVSHVN